MSNITCHHVPYTRSGSGVAIRSTTGAYYNEGNVNLSLTRTRTNGMQYHDTNAQHAADVLPTPNAGAARKYSEADEGG